jgi:hypothetical protein
LGNIQSQKAEIIKVQTPNASSLAFATSTVFAHSRGEKIQFIPYNQIEVYKDDTLLTTLDIRVDALETYQVGEDPCSLAVNCPA